jgi:CHAT domain-containing protein/tetratricopeptide (TPR) repeat protein
VVLVGVAGLFTAGGGRGDEEKKGPAEELTAEQRAALEKEVKEAGADVERHYRAGRVKEALQAQERALAACEKLFGKQDNTDVATCLNNIAFLWYALGDPRQALPYAERALAMRQRLYPDQDNAPTAAALGRMGQLLQALGQPREALAYLERALAMQERLHRGQDHLDLANALNNLASVLRAVGEPRQALPYQERALAMLERLYPKQDHRDLAVNLNNMGYLLDVLGESRRALPYYQRALDMYERLYPKQDHPLVANSLHNLGLALQVLGEPRQALPYHERSLAMFERVYPKLDRAHVASSLNATGLVLYALGEPRQALPYLERSLAMYERLYPKQDHPLLAQSLHNTGHLLFTLGEPRRAMAHLQRALAMYRGYVDDLAAYAPEAEGLAFAASLPRTRDGLLSVARHVDDSDAGTYARVWDAKAAVTRVLERRHLAARAAQDKQASETWRELGDTRRQLARLLLQPTANKEARDKEVNRLTERKEKLERDLAALLPELRQRPERDRLGPDDLARRLPDGSAFLDFVRYVALDINPDKPGKDGEKWSLSYAAFVLAKGRTVKRVELGPARPIDGAVTGWRQAIADWRADLAPAARTDLMARADRHAAELRRLVWDKLAGQLPTDTTTLYLSPDGDLARLPWAALPTGKADKVLLDDYLLASVPHGPFLLARLMDKTSTPGDGGTLVVYGGVDYEKAPDTLARADTRGPHLGSESHAAWPGLPGTERERQAVAALGEQALKESVVSRSGRAANTAQLLMDLPRARYAHLATHGFFAQEQLAEERERIAEQLKGWAYQSGRVTERVGAGVRSPLAYTGLVLAGANAPDKAGPDGGVATGEALVDLPLEGLRLCVLSACETGLGELTDGEGVQGLVRAFHLAGCPDVVASLWQVNDRATAALMAKFYHELWVNKRPPIEALREAQLLVARRPDLVDTLAGERGAAKLKEAVKVVPSDEPPKELAGGERLPPKLWAAFVLSGPGR